jgi:hypothetical protein
MEIAAQLTKQINNEDWRNKYLNRIMELEYKKKEIMKLKKELQDSKTLEISHQDLEKSTAMSTSYNSINNINKNNLNDLIINKEKKKKEKNLTNLLNSINNKNNINDDIKVEKEEIKSISTYSSSSIDTKTAMEAWENIIHNTIFNKVVRLRKGAFGLTNNQYLRIYEFTKKRLDVSVKPKKNIDVKDIFALATNLHFWAKKYGTNKMKQNAKDILQLIHDYNEYAEPKQPSFDEFKEVKDVTLPKETIKVRDEIATKLEEKMKADKMISGTTKDEIQKYVKKEEEKEEKEWNKELEKDENRQFYIKRDKMREKNANKRFNQQQKNNRYYQNRNYNLNKNKYQYQRKKDEQQNRRNEANDAAINRYYQARTEKIIERCGGYESYV